ncbi:MAG: hypothetical protein ACI9ES_000509 [Oceanospirillaceae bacterium]|jgi:hypothetical protein
MPGNKYFHRLLSICISSKKTNKLVLLISVLFTSPLYSAIISYTEDRPFSELHIQGEIIKGDYQKILNIVRKQRDIPYLLSIDSKGGNVMEALKIGSFTRKYLLKSESRKCNSACIFILLGSLHPPNNNQGVIGIHRPKFNRAYFSNLNAQEATDKYKTLHSIVSQYMTNMGARKLLVDKMFSIPSGSMDYLKKQQFYSMVNNPPAGYSEWIISKCGDDLTLKEQQDLISSYRNNTLFNKKYIARLDAKSTEHFNCELESVRNEQMRIYNTDPEFNHRKMSLY